MKKLNRQSRVALSKCLEFLKDAKRNQKNNRKIVARDYVNKEHGVAALALALETSNKYVFFWSRVLHLCVEVEFSGLLFSSQLVNKEREISQ